MPWQSGPGGPRCLARAGEKLVFGLPGNPVSTMVTFELFVLPALDVLSGAEAAAIARCCRAKLGDASCMKRPGVTHFLAGAYGRARGRSRGQSIEMARLWGYLGVVEGKLFCYRPGGARKDRCWRPRGSNGSKGYVLNQQN